MTLSPEGSQRKRLPLEVLVIVAALICIALSVASEGGQRALTALILFLFFSVLVARSPMIGVPCVLIFLSILGGLRRWLIPLWGLPANDPLLLVNPALVCVYVANLLLTRQLPRDTQLSRQILWLLGLMVIEVVNPLQGGLTVGLAGALFYVIPFCWFFIGRIAGEPALLKRVFRTTVMISLLAAAYGLFQTLFGFTASEKEWIRSTGSLYQALNVGNAVRAFSFFTSSAEYTQFVGLGIVLLWAAWLRGHRRILLLLPVLMIALFLASSRGAVVAVLVTCVILWAVQGRTLRVWLPRAGLALILGVGGLAWSLMQVQEQVFDDRTQDLITHQTSGLLNPMDESNSTAGVHLNMVADGIFRGVMHPLGVGLGATTLAAAKFGGNGGSTEVDLSNMFVSLGLLGGVLYTIILGTVLVSAFRQWQQGRSVVSLQVIAVLCFSFGSWLNGGHYAGSMLAWFLIGAMDRAFRKVNHEISHRHP